MISSNPYLELKYIMHIRNKFFLFPTEKHINVGTQPLSAGLQTQRIKINEFLDRFKLRQWINGYIINSPYDECTYKTIDYTQFEKYKNDIRMNRKKYAVFFMNNELGSTLIATDKIPQNSLITIYGGVLYKEDETLNTDYVYTIDPESETLYEIDAEENGNIARFMQHLPLTSNAYYLSEKAENNIALQNVTVRDFSYKGLCFTGYFAKYDIRAGEIIGWDYSKRYWLASAFSPTLFTRNGGILDSGSYGIKKLHIRVQFKQNDRIETISNINFSDFFDGENFNNKFNLRLRKGLLVLTHDEYEEILRQAFSSPYINISRNSENSLSTKCLPAYEEMSETFSDEIEDTINLLNEINQLSKLNEDWFYDLGRNVLALTLNEPTDADIFKHSFEKHHITFSIVEDIDVYVLRIHNPISKHITASAKEIHHSIQPKCSPTSLKF